MDSRSSSVVSTAISSYSALSFTSNFTNTVNNNNNNAHSRDPTVNQLLSKYTQSNRQAHIHGGDLVIFSVPPAASSSPSSPQGKNDNDNEVDQKENSLQPNNNNDNEKSPSCSYYSGIFSKPCYSFGELRPLFALTRLRLLYEFHLRNVVSSLNKNDKNSNNNNNFYVDDNENNNLKIELNPIMTKILYSSSSSDSSPSRNNNNDFFTSTNINNNPSLFIYSELYVQQNITMLEQQLKDILGISTKSGAGRVANYARTVKKKNILFDFDEDVLENASILRMRKIRNVAEWFMKVNFLKNLLIKQKGFLLEAKKQNNNNNNNSHQQATNNSNKNNNNNNIIIIINSSPFLTNSTSATTSHHQKRREVCGHIVTFPALTLFLTNVASDSNNSGFSSRPLSGLALLALVCAEHGQLEMAVAATRILPFGGTTSTAIRDNYYDYCDQENNNFSDQDGGRDSKLRKKHGNEAKITDVAERTEFLVGRAAREREMHQEFEAVLKSAKQNNNINHNNSNDGKNKATSSSSPSSGKTETAVAKQQQQNNSIPTSFNFSEAVKTVKASATSIIVPSKISSLQDAINFLVDNKDSTMTDREKQLVLKNAGDDGLDSEERQRRRLASKFGQTSQQRAEQNISRLLEKFGKSVAEANFIHNRIGFRDPINIERNKIEKFLLRNFPLQSPSSYKKEISLFTAEVVEKLYSSPKITSSLQERYLCLCDMFCVNPNRHFLFSSSFSQYSTPEELTEISFKGNYIGDRGLLPVLELCRFHHDLSNNHNNTGTKNCGNHPDDRENASIDANLSETLNSIPIDEPTQMSASTTMTTTTTTKKVKKVVLTREEKLDLRHVAGNRNLLGKYCTLTPNFSQLELPNVGISDVGCEFICEWLIQKFIVEVRSNENNSSSSHHRYRCCKKLFSGSLKTFKINLSGNRDIGMGGAMCFIRTLEKIRKICFQQQENQKWIENSCLSLEKMKLEPTAFEKEQREREKQQNENTIIASVLNVPQQEKGMELLEDGAFFTLATTEQSKQQNLKSAKNSNSHQHQLQEVEDILDPSLANEIQNDDEERYCFVFIDLRNCCVGAGLCRRIVQLGLI